MKLSVIIFRDRDGKILLQFRDSGAPSDPLGWSFFGGVTEGDETPLDAILREVKEELEVNLRPGDVRLLVERPWVSPSGREKTVYLYEGITPINWRDFAVREGAGAAFLSKDEVARLDKVSLLARTFIAEYC